MSEPGAPVVEAHTHSGHDHHDGPCTCRTDCTGATAIRTAASPGIDRAPPTDPSNLRIDAAPALLPVRALLPHVLPWPTAPPRG
ncbi:MAG: hypothetical protein EA351_04360 [Gemmatimonadales bacterium]|nr:MAG: hypothetical protein EA351_04360 [Gemmatimonadales bacterium]